MTKTAIKRLITELNMNRMTAEEALQELNDNGLCPTVLNDDQSRWAISCDGYQSVALTNEPADVEFGVWVEARFFKPSITEALIYFLKDVLVEIKSEA